MLIKQSQFLLKIANLTASNKMPRSTVSALEVKFIINILVSTNGFNDTKHLALFDTGSLQRHAEALLRSSLLTVAQLQGVSILQLSACKNPATRRKGHRTVLKSAMAFKKEGKEAIQVFKRSNFTCFFEIRALVQKPEDADRIFTNLLTSAQALTRTGSCTVVATGISSRTLRELHLL